MFHFERFFFKEKGIFRRENIAIIKLIVSCFEHSIYIGFENKGKLLKSKDLMFAENYNEILFYGIHENV